MTPEQAKGLDGQVETVTVKGADGSPVRINKVDFDPKVHEEYTESKAAAKGKKDRE